MTAPSELLRRTCATILRERSGQLKKLPGNFVVHVPGVTSFTVVVAGEKLGIHDGALDVPIGCAIRCSEEALDALLAGESVIDFVANDTLEVAGDVNVLTKFLALVEPQSLLALRASRS